MTRKDYSELALDINQIVRRVYPYDSGGQGCKAISHLVDEHCATFKRLNPHFDTKRFVKAAYIGVENAYHADIARLA